MLFEWSTVVSNPLSLKWRGGSIHRSRYWNTEVKTERGGKNNIGEILESHLNLQSNGKVEVIYIQWTSVSKFISISFCLFQWKLKFLSSKWLIHVVSERCDISRFSWLGTLLHLELWKRVRVLFFSLAFYGIFWDAISGYKVINSALAELFFFWRSFQNIARFRSTF